MNEKVIDIHPYLIRDNLISLGICAELDGVKEKFILKDSDKLNLYNIELTGGEILIPRKTSSKVKITITNAWRTPQAKSELFNLVRTGENPEDVFALRIRASCHKTFWSSAQVVLKMSEIGKKDTELTVSLNDVQEQIFIEAYVTRELQGSRTEPLKAASTLSIVSANDEMSIQIDELEAIGGNYLPIKPKDMKDAVFKISVTDSESLPVIFYASEFEKPFRRNDLPVINAAFLMIMPALIDQYLKWLLFRARADHSDKEQKALVDKITKVAGISKDDFYEIMEGGSVETKVSKYLELSQKLFEGIQNKAGVNFKKELERLISIEKKLKGEQI